MSRRPLITLLTDFGYKDHYVAAMKGVILSICPEARIVDIAHGVPKFDVRAAAYVLRGAYRYFPPGTIHVVVVDPGVGTERRAVAVKSRNYIFIGPDNGVLSLALAEDGVKEARVIENRDLMLPRITYTFHGRDIFAPVAAHLARGVPFSLVGRRLERLREPSFTRPLVRGRELVCEVLYVDDFGNAALNIDERLLRELGVSYGAELAIELRGKELALKLLPSYGHAPEGAPLLLINSEGFLEIAVNRGSAAEAFGLSPGSRLRIRILSPPPRL